jgi:equilibrative nucleoside transporter 1/2/3
MDKVRAYLRTPVSESEYQRIDTDEDIVVRRPVIIREEDDDDAAALVPQHQEPFSWFEYSIFCLLGIAMLWAWSVADPSSLQCAPANSVLGICS